MRIQKISRNTLLIFGIFIFTIVLGVGFNIISQKPASNLLEIKDHVGIPMAHASPGTNTGCVSCHTEPISADCSSCHGDPPIKIGDISFPHHDTSSGGPLDSCNSCHGGGDARYAESPNFRHSFCTGCHDLKHGG
jgi:hypothetical protein